MTLTIYIEPMDRVLEKEPNNFHASVFALVKEVLADGGAVIVKPAYGLCRTPIINPVYCFDEPSDLSQWDEMIAALRALHKKCDDEDTEELEAWLRRGCKRK